MSAQETRKLRFLKVSIRRFILTKISPQSLVTPETVALSVSLCYLKQCLEENVSRIPGMTMYIIPP